MSGAVTERRVADKLTVPSRLHVSNTQH